MSEEKIKKQHFVLVHGVCHGAWCWYKVKPLLEASGYIVSVLDLAAAGIDTTKSITEISTCEQYSEPLTKLLALLPSNEKVVLVGHSFGGMSISLAMDKFPNKIAVAVYVAAFMPDTKHSPSLVLDKVAIEVPREVMMDSVFELYGSDNSGLSMLFSNDCMKHLLYNLSPIEDLELGCLLKRPGSLFINDFSKRNNFSKDGYGCVPRAYILCNKDRIISPELQRWMIDNYPANVVIEMEEADHMPMFCKPRLLSDHLMEIANKFA